MQVRSAVQGATCGYQMQPGEEYIIYTAPQKPPSCEIDNNKNPDFGVNLCGGNIASPTADQVAELAEACGALCEGLAPPEPTCEEKCEAKCTKRCEDWCNATPWRG